MPNAPKIDRAHVISWLSEPRYSKYLEVTRGDDAVALDLYLWNIGLVAMANAKCRGKRNVCG